MREQATTQAAEPASLTPAEPAHTSSDARAAAGSLAVNRIGRLDGPALLAGLRGPPAQVGAFLESAAARGELKDAVHELTAQQSQAVLQPALRTLQGGALTAQRKDMLEAVFDGTPDGFNVTLMLCFELRFGLKRVGLMKGEGGALWDTTGLRRTWSVMKALPEAHTEARPELVEFERDEPGSGGVYMPERDAVGIEAVDRHGGSNEYKMTNADGNFDPNTHDVLDPSNFFDSTVRHEVGHSVDQRIKASTGYCTTPAGGTWTMYDTPDQLLKALYDSVGLSVPTGVTITAPEAPDAPASADPMGDKADASAGPATKHHAGPHPDAHAIEFEIWEALLGVAAHGKTTAAQHLVHTHAADLAKHNLSAIPHVLQLLTAGVKENSKSGPSAWDRPDGGSMHVGSRTFFKDDDSWSSYATEARSRKVSTYQFRSPYEWFAECYSAYYDPRGGAHGGLLAQADPATKRWFDENVDNLKTAPKPGKAPGANKRT